MRIYSKRISDKFLSLNVNVNTNLKILCALGGLSEGDQMLGHSESTWALGHLERTWAIRGTLGT